MLKTFFFVYVGVSIRLTEPWIAYAALALTALIFVLRIPCARIGLSRTTPKHDAALVAVMCPKGLAAVVLAGIPLEQHLPGGATLQAVTYAIVFLSIVFTSVLSFLIERTAVAKVYSAFFGGFAVSPPAEPAQSSSAGASV